MCQKHSKRSPRQWHIQDLLVSGLINTFCFLGFKASQFSTYSVLKSTYFHVFGRFKPPTSTLNMPPHLEKVLAQESQDKKSQLSNAFLLDDYFFQRTVFEFFSKICFMALVGYWPISREYKSDQNKLSTVEKVSLYPFQWRTIFANQI